MTLRVGQTDPQVRASYVDRLVLSLGKQGFVPRENERGEILCSRCLQPLGKDDTVYCMPCHDILDGILAASRNSTSVRTVS